MTGPIILVGCGKMGGALLGGWLAAEGEPRDIHVIEAHSSTADAVRSRNAPSVQVHGRPDQVSDSLSPSAVVFAVKPQSLDAVVAEYRRFGTGPASGTGTGTVFLSIAAGKRIGFFEDRLGAHAAIVRAMPNTPAAIGRGISVACANQHVTGAQKALCQTLLEAAGEVAWVDDEDLLDPVTAVSGSGPAYVFLLIEALAAAGVAAGLDRALSDRLALATVAGAGELARRDTDPPDVLRQNVTSPGGTTEAALGILMADDGLRPLLVRAVEAATARSRALAG